MSITNENFIEKAWDSIKADFVKAESLEQKIAAFANKVVNEIKGLQSNQTVQFLESGLVAAAEAVDPALTPLISGLELELPKILSLVSKGTAEISAPASQQLSDFVTAIENIKGINGTVYAGILATLSSAIAQYINTNNGIVASDSQVIAVQQVVHQLAA